MYFHGDGYVCVRMVVHDLFKCILQSFNTPHTSSQAQRPRAAGYSLPSFIVLNDHVRSAYPTVMTTIRIVCVWHPYTRDHGCQWSYVESPCEGKKQKRNMNDDDTQSTWQGCQLNVELMRWRGGAFVWWWLRVCTYGGSRLIQVCPSFI